MGAPVLFSNLIFVGLPSRPLGIEALQGSVLSVAVASNTGAVVGVSVGRGVCVGVSVAGMGVEVGIAACVSAMMVNAAATAVFWMLAISTVGAACALHALIVIAIANNKENEMCFILINNVGSMSFEL